MPTFEKLLSLCGFSKFMLDHINRRKVGNHILGCLWAFFYVLFYLNSECKHNPPFPQPMHFFSVLSQRCPSKRRLWLWLSSSMPWLLIRGVLKPGRVRKVGFCFFLQFMLKSSCSRDDLWIIRLLCICRWVFFIFFINYVEKEAQYSCSKKDT